jgi:hypothetical protein
MKDKPSLARCSYCERNMSSALDNCPHCGKLVPRMFSCGVCGRDVRSIDAVNEYGVEINRPACIHTYHSSCYKIISAECTCPVCKYTFTAEERRQRKSRDSNCPECGHRIYFTSCHKCWGELISESCVALMQRPWDETATLRHYHCHTLIEAQEAQIREQRKRNKQCIICGKNLGFFDLFFEREKHQGC